MKAALEKILFYLGFLLIRLLYASCRIKNIDSHQKDNAKSLHPQGSFILACWHEHVIMVLFSQAGTKYHPIVSKAGAGRFVGLVCTKFGHSPIHGSEDRGGKNKGGAAAMFALLRCLKKGAAVCFTVDGSIGPRRYVKQGIIELSRVTNARIVPAGFACNRVWQLNTWDRMKVPKPFSTIYAYYGSPLEIPPAMNSDEFPALQSSIAEAINAAEQKAEECQRNGIPRS